MSNKFRFTSERINTAAAPTDKKEAFYRDESTPGLGLRVTANDVRSFIFEASMHGKSMRITIGDIKTWTIKQAQEEARRMMVQVDQGKDPRLEKQLAVKEQEATKKQLRREDVTFGEVWAQYVEEMTNSGQWGQRHIHKHQSVIQVGGQSWQSCKSRKKEAGVLYPMTKVSMSGLTVEFLLTLIEREQKGRPSAMAQAVRMLRAFNAWAQDHTDYKNLIDQSIFTSKRMKDRTPKAKARQDVLRRAQIADWFALINRIGNHNHRVYIQMLLLTGARRAEIASLQWSNINWTLREMVIRDKNETSGEDIGFRTIPLTPYVETLLKSLRRQAGSDWVFPNRRKDNDSYMVGGDGVYRQLFEDSEVEYVTFHGLRRSFRTLSEYVGMPSGVAAQIMGHKPSAVQEKHYTVRDTEFLQTWAAKFEEWLLQEAGMTPPAAGSTLRLVA
jgi:integrase